MRLPVNHLLTLAALTMTAGQASAEPASQLPVTDPAADYPIVLGETFTVGDRSYTPVDKLNYDEVGHASVAAGEGGAISAAHKTLPLPSYVEVTSLTTGRTILVRVERRGPMSNEVLVELSPGAAAQLGIASTERQAVRVRRVNPPEPERALLRTGKRAPERMATPKGLLDALNRKLQPQTGPVPTIASPPPSQQIAAAAPKPATPVPAAPTPRPSAAPPASMRPAAASAAPRPAASTGLVVQIAAFSTRERADNAARKLGATVTPAGRLWRIRLGPFAVRSEAEAALAKAKGAGYSDARIQRAD